MSDLGNARGYFGVALDNPKTAHNVGGVLRAAQVYGASFVSISGARNKCVKHPTNTMAAHRHMPVHIVEDPLAVRPYDCQVVAVDLVPGAVSLIDFKHPERAIYVFGAEDQTLGRRILERSQHAVMVPTRHCMNLSAAVNVILYDRLAKSAAQEGRG